MIDHLEIQTASLEPTLSFYGIALGPLGYRLTVDGPAKGFSDGRSLDFFVREGTPSNDVHYAFVAPSRLVVDRIYGDAKAAGLTLDRAPALAPHIHPNYYAGYLRDPDGRLIEFVCQKGEGES